MGVGNFDMLRSEKISKVNCHEHKLRIYHSVLPKTGNNQLHTFFKYNSVLKYCGNSYFIYICVRKKKKMKKSMLGMSKKCNHRYFLFECDPKN